MKKVSFSLVLLSVFFGSFNSQAIAKNNTFDNGVVSIQPLAHAAQSQLRSAERILSFIDRQCQGQDAACFERKLDTGVRYRASSKA